MTLRRPATSHAHTVERHHHATAFTVARADTQGRIALWAQARLLGWNHETELALVPRDQAVEIVRRGVSVGTAVSLDARQRLTVPYGLRVALDLDRGSQLLVVAAAITGSTLLLPTSALTDVLLRST